MDHDEYDQEMEQFSPDSANVHDLDGAKLHAMRSLNGGILLRVGGVCLPN